MTVQPTRDQLRALANAATPGPWEVHGSLIGIGRAKPDFGQTWGLHWRQDIEFICAARTALPHLLDQLDQAEAELDSWMARAYEAEKRAWQAEARIKAVQDVLGEVEAGESWFRPVDVTGTPFPTQVDVDRIRRALESVPPPSA